MEVFRKLSSLILLGSILVSPLNLLFSFYLQLLLFLVSLLSLLLSCLIMISGQIFRSTRPCIVPLFCSSVESHRLLRCCVRSLLSHIRACKHHLITLLPSILVRFVLHLLISSSWESSFSSLCLCWSSIITGFSLILYILSGVVSTLTSLTVAIPWLGQLVDPVANSKIFHHHFEWIIKS